jgi:hypothetical protein
MRLIGKIEALSGTTPLLVERERFDMLRLYKERENINDIGRSRKTVYP